MSIIREVICLQCPFACRIEVELSEDGTKEITSMKNQKCSRGEAYAAQEIINPVRTLTTTVRISSRDKEHPLLPVQTERPIPKELLKEAMRVLAKVAAKPPVKYGDIIMKDLLGTGVDVKANFEILE